MKSSLRKGKAYERFIARTLRTHFSDAERQSQFRGGHHDGSDVLAGPWAIECKHVQTLNLKAALVQAWEAAQVHRRRYAVIFRWSARGRPVFPEGQDFICLRLADALEFLRNDT